MSALLLSYGQVAALLGVCRKTVERRVRRDPKFPKPVTVGTDRIHRFHRSEVEKWIADLPRVQAAS